MKLLLVKYSKYDYYLLSPDTYGMESWGTNSQTSLEKKRKYWYICDWRAGNSFVDDHESKFKINVVLETTDIDEILKYLTEHNSKCHNSVLYAFKEIVNYYVSYEIGIREK